MDNKFDNAILGTLKALAIGVALAGVLAADIASAEYRPYKYYEHYGFDAELQNCVDLLRPTINATAEEKVSYTVRDVSLRGPWYRFELSTSTYGPDGQVRLDGFKVLCKSNRWVDSARLIERKNSPLVMRQLVVRTTSELMTYNAMARNVPVPTQ